MSSRHTRRSSKSENLADAGDGFGTSSPLPASLAPASSQGRPERLKSLSPDSNKEPSSRTRGGKGTKLDIEANPAKAVNSSALPSTPLGGSAHASSATATPTTLLAALGTAALPTSRPRRQANPPKFSAAAGISASLAPDPTTVKRKCADEGSADLDADLALQSASLAGATCEGEGEKVQVGPGSLYPMPSCQVDDSNNVQGTHEKSSTRLDGTAPLTLGGASPTEVAAPPRGATSSSGAAAGYNGLGGASPSLVPPTIGSGALFQLPCSTNQPTTNPQAQPTNQHPSQFQGSVSNHLKVEVLAGCEEGAARASTAQLAGPHQSGEVEKEPARASTAQLAGPYHSGEEEKGPARASTAQLAGLYQSVEAEKGPARASAAQLVNPYQYREAYHGWGGVSVSAHVGESSDTPLPTGTGREFGGDVEGGAGSGGGGGSSPSPPLSSAAARQEEQGPLDFYPHGPSSNVGRGGQGMHAVAGPSHSTATPMRAAGAEAGAGMLEGGSTCPPDQGWAGAGMLEGGSTRPHGQGWGTLSSTPVLQSGFSSKEAGRNLPVGQVVQSSSPALPSATAGLAFLGKSRLGHSYAPGDPLDLGHPAPLDLGHGTPQNLGHAAPLDLGHAAPLNLGHAAPHNLGHAASLDLGHAAPQNLGHAGLPPSLLYPPSPMPSSHLTPQLQAALVQQMVAAAALATAKARLSTAPPGGAQPSPLPMAPLPPGGADQGPPFGSRSPLSGLDPLMPMLPGRPGQDKAQHFPSTTYQDPAPVKPEHLPPHPLTAGDMALPAYLQHQLSFTPGKPASPGMGVRGYGSYGDPLHPPQHDPLAHPGLSPYPPTPVDPRLIQAHLMLAHRHALAAQEAARKLASLQSSAHSSSTSSPTGQPGVRGGVATVKREGVGAGSEIGMGAGAGTGAGAAPLGGGGRGGGAGTTDSGLWEDALPDPTAVPVPRKSRSVRRLRQSHWHSILKTLGMQATAGDGAPGDLNRPASAEPDKSGPSHKGRTLSRPPATFTPNGSTAPSPAPAAGAGGGGAPSKGVKRERGKATARTAPEGGAQDKVPGAGPQVSEAPPGVGTEKPSQRPMRLAKQLAPSAAKQLAPTSARQLAPTASPGGKQPAAASAKQLSSPPQAKGTKGRTASTAEPRPGQETKSVAEAVTATPVGPSYGDAGSPRGDTVTSATHSAPPSTQPSPSESLQGVALAQPLTKRRRKLSAPSRAL
eukprot:gene5325-33710_t